MKKLANYSVAVKNIQEGVETYSKIFGLELMKPISDSPKFGFRTAWLGDGKDAFVELIEPTDPEGPVARFLEQKGEGVYLVCFEVDDLGAAVKQVRANGGRITGLPKGTDPTPETKQVWVHPASTKGVFTQLRRAGAAD